MGSESKYPIETKPRLQRLGAKVLEGLLTEARQHLRDVTRLLRQLPTTLPEYDALLNREGKLHDLIEQLIGQIAARRRSHD